MTKDNYHKQDSILNIFDLRNNTPKDFSVIIPIYNTGKYLREAINSVINQTHGFQNIEIILLNDGSSDESEIICKQYLLKHPENIVYIEKINSGVSDTRNLGLKFAKGTFVNFLDSDDKWGITTFKNAYNLFKENENLNIVSSRLSFFDALKGDHPLNYKFESKSSKIVNVEEFFESILMNVSSSFFRKCIIEKQVFDTSLKFAEDAKFVHEVVKQNNMIGLLSYTEGCYWYRKRKDELSTIDSSVYTKEYYIDTVKKFYYELLDENNFESKYTQMMIMYDLQWRLKFPNAINQVLTKSEINIYKNLLYEIISKIDDEVIMSSALSNISPVTRLALLKIKHVDKELSIQKLDSELFIVFDDIKIKEISKFYLNIDFINLKDDFIDIGVSLPQISKSYHLIPVIENGRDNIMPIYSSVINEQKILGDSVSVNNFYRFKISLQSLKNTELVFKYLIENNGETEYVKMASFPKHTNFIKGKITYRNIDNKTVLISFNKDKKSLKVIKKDYKLSVDRYFRLFKNKKIKSILYLIIANIFNKFKKKPIWIFFDRVDMANDNAEALFRYTMKNSKEVNAFFVVNKSSKDFNRLKEEFPKRILNFKTKKYHLIYLIANKIFTSHAEDVLFRPFGKENTDWVKSNFNYEFIFIQHGVIHNDLSNWLHKRNKPIDKIITSSKYESNHIIEKYGFTEDEVLEFGLARFDLLDNNVRNSDKLYTITVMPTWRPKLILNKREKFEDSEYFESYYSLLNHKLFNRLNQNHKIKINFVQHPRMRIPFNHYFEDLNHVNIADHIDYSDVIENSDLLITDVSSVAFDFAYNNKPVIYFHQEINEIYENASYDRGYFNYEAHGFGQVVYNINELMDEVEKLLRNNFKMEYKYKERVKDFYTHFDNQNRKRTVEYFLDEN